MRASITRRTCCRLCGSPRLELALPMVPSPIADAYVPPDRRDEPDEAYPLDVHLCLDCGHAQNLDVVDRGALFVEYAYRTASSLGLVRHLAGQAADVLRRSAPPAGSLVVEIGSNDGSLLAVYRDAGMRVLGVDPARDLAEEATRRGLPTRPVFFDAAEGASIAEELGRASVVVANNVFAHADDLEGVARGVRALLGDDGVFVFEVSYLPDIVERFLFDTIYHEHLSYHSVAPLAAFFERLGLELYDVVRVASKGGSIRGFVGRKGAHPVEASVAEHVELERRGGFATLAPFQAFAAAIAERKARLLDLLDAVIARGGTVAGFGASATVTTLVHQLDLGQRLAFLVDDNPSKHGFLSPGARLPVLPPSALAARAPALCVVLAWAYAEPILARHGAWVQTGGRFVVPLPELRVVG